jgi:small subunit ribosomal protein S10
MSVAVIKLISTSIKDIDTIANQIKSIAKQLGVKNAGPIPLPTHRMMHTTRRTPAADGSHTFEKWEMRLHKRLIEIDGSEQALRQVMRIPVPDTVQIEISLAE